MTTATPTIREFLHGGARLVLVLFACLANVHAAEAAGGLLDGITVHASFVDKAGTKQGDDRLVFAAGKLDAPGLRKAFAFEPAAYIAEKDKNGAVSFSATLTSAEHGSLAIVGRITKQGASGKRTWSKPGKEPIEHAFTGGLK